MRPQPAFTLNDLSSVSVSQRPTTENGYRHKKRGGINDVLRSRFRKNTLWHENWVIRTEKSVNLVLCINKSHLLATAYILVALRLNYSHICRGSLQANLIIWATSVPSFI